MNPDHDPVRPGTVELVPRPDGTWTPATRSHPLAHKVRAWLWVWFSPAPPESYLAPDEVCLIWTRRHWLVPLKRIAQAGVMLPVAILLTLVTTFLLPGVWWLQVAVWLGTVAHQGWLVYRVIEWRLDELLVTDRRLIRVHGVFTTTVDAVKLEKITDSTYHQPFLGHVLLGYGSLRIETSGQAQALEQLDYIPRPAEVYRATLQ